ncbi:MAG TPA: hypothetical protein VJ440_14385, partial [Candidatus Brocadiaceae bacterium]|nr:hypothetical protein [Candidatus Brocadiaceae bacterium]
DQYGNPISNLPVDFEAQAAVPQGSCANPGNKTAQLVKTNDTCLTSAPVWDQCGTANTLITETTNSAGAAVNTILGQIPAAKYPIKATCTDAKCIDQATNQPRSATFNHYTADFGNCGSDGLEVPDAMLILKTTETTDASGHIINAGKSGTSIPVSARIYYLKEGDIPKPYTYSCGLVCDRLVGNQTYSIETTFTTASVSFAGQAGNPQGNGVYAGTYTLPQLPGEYTVSIDATAGTTVKRTHNACPNYCTPMDQTTEPLSLSGSMTKTVYSVGIALSAIPTIFVDEQGYAQKDNAISYTISPTKYQALSASVEIYKNGSLIAAIPTAKQGTGMATIARGFQFDINSTYQAEVVLNAGTGVEMRSGKVGLTITVLKVELVDSNDNPITTTQVGENENFVSWKTLEVKYKITPPFADTEYDWEVTKGTATVSGHDGLGTPSPTNVTVNKTNRVISFVPNSTGSKQIASDLKAKPLAYALVFKLNGQMVKTFNIQQSDRNAIREEYKVYSAPEENRPTYADFDGKLLAQNLKNCPYAAVDIPKGEKLNNLFNVLPANEYTFTSSYRNPYKNQSAGSLSAQSRHVWSGAIDLLDKNGAGKTTELKTLWTNIKNKAEFGQMFVESVGGDIEQFINEYLTKTLKKNLVADSLIIKSMQNTYTPTYAIVWSKQTGWQWVKFDWQEQMPDDSIMQHTDDQYTFQESDWAAVARNLHAQDKITSEWGF